MSSVADECLRIVLAGERLKALLEPLRCVTNMVENVREIAPELEPELKAIDSRVCEVLNHVIAGVEVLNAKADIL